MVLSAFIILYCVVSICVLGNSRTIGGTPTGRCAGCKYDLAGLAKMSPCPECGSMDRETWGGRSTVDPQRQARWTPTFILFILSVVLSHLLAEGVLILSYEYDHFSVSAALASMRVRELSDLGPGTGAVLWPLLLCVALSPLLALLRDRRQSRWLILTLIGAGALATIAVWTVLQDSYPR